MEMSCGFHRGTLQDIRLRFEGQGFLVWLRDELLSEDFDTMRMAPGALSLCYDYVAIAG